MRIITISREFGSGGRELGKRLAEELGIPCYDQQIIEMIAEKRQLDKNYVSHVSEKDVRMMYPSTIGKHFVVPHFSGNQVVEVLSDQKKIIEEYPQCDRAKDYKRRTGKPPLSAWQY